MNRQGGPAKRFVRNPHGDYGLGEHALSLKASTGTQIHRFTVAPKQYPEEHLTIANERMVHPTETSL